MADSTNQSDRPGGFVEIRTGFLMAGPPLRVRINTSGDNLHEPRPQHPNPVNNQQADDGNYELLVSAEEVVEEQRVQGGEAEVEEVSADDNLAEEQGLEDFEGVAGAIGGMEIVRQADVEGEDDVNGEEVEVGDNKVLAAAIVPEPAVFHGIVATLALHPRDVEVITLDRPDNPVIDAAQAQYFPYSVLFRQGNQFPEFVRLQTLQLRERDINDVNDLGPATGHQYKTTISFGGKDSGSNLSVTVDAFNINLSWELASERFLTLARDQLGWNVPQFYWFDEGALNNRVVNVVRDYLRKIRVRSTLEVEFLEVGMFRARIVCGKYTFIGEHLVRRFAINLAANQLHIHYCGYPFYKMLYFVEEGLLDSEHYMPNAIRIEQSRRCSN